MKNCIIASTSTLHGQDYLEYILPILKNHFKNAKSIVFIPFARPGGISHDAYTAIVSNVFKTINIEVKGLHTFENKTEALKNAEGIFTGGGNTFVLVNELHKTGIIPVLKEVLENGTPYLGTSAGSNICGINMKTTNDMPIVYPPSFETIGVVPFNINPHYLDPIDGNKHMGETRETRINEFHSQNNIPVIGLREGSWLHLINNQCVLEGDLTARIFLQNQSPFEIEPKTNLFEFLK